MPRNSSALYDLAAEVPSLRTCERSGTVSQLVGLTTEVAGLASYIGEQVQVHSGQWAVGSGQSSATSLCRLPTAGRAHSRAPLPLPTAHCLLPTAYCLLGEVVGFRANRSIVMPYGGAAGIAAGSRVVATGHPARVTVGDDLLGRVIGGLGAPLDDGPPVRGRAVELGTASVAHPLRRLPISERFTTGIRVLDGLLTCGRGQRLGIFAGSGVGKSTFLGMIARNSDSDVNVIALIGERGREVQEFIAHNLGPEGLNRSVVIVATSDQPALLRLSAAWTAAAIAEHFRDSGRHVLFMMDSVTRFAMAQREIGLAVGEPPATRGYTPSVFALLPRLLERAGTGVRGSITGFYTVLVEGDDLNEPITDAVRGTLDGHIVLSRDLAMAHHYPAVDVLGSISRLMPHLTSPEHQAQAARVRTLLAAYQAATDLLEIGAYIGGSNADVDEALLRLPQIHAFLRQSTHDSSPWPETVQELEAMVP